MSGAVRGVGLVLLGVTVMLSGAWGVLAILNLGTEGQSLRPALAGVYGVTVLLALLALTRSRWRWHAVAGHGVLLAALIGWFFSFEPSNDRAWQTDVSRLAWAEVDGERVTMHNVRNFDYRTETDYTPAWYDRTYDLRQLEGVDVIATYWMGPAIAHIFLSFGFSGGEQLAVSIETRKETHESYSTVKGFFRQYELYYVVADERDVIRLRTNYRHNPDENLYIYRAKGQPDAARRLFLEYVEKINGLKAKPEFYNSLTTNCTTGIWSNDAVNANRVPMSWKVLASGYVPEYLYENGRLIDGGLTLAELQRRAHANARARAADKAPDFSRRIRAEP
jgi:hypothetical protein